MEAVENGTVLLSNCQPNIFMTFAFDNNDLAEETLKERTPHMVLIVLLSSAKQIAA